jgi:hypothetical protein
MLVTVNEIIYFSVFATYHIYKHKNFVSLGMNIVL